MQCGRWGGLLIFFMQNFIKGIVWTIAGNETNDTILVRRHFFGKFGVFHYKNGAKYLFSITAISISS